MQRADLLARQQRRSFWLRQLHQWHWISAAICLVAMLLFSITGITLNHASSIESAPQVSRKNLQMPVSVLNALGAREEGHAPLPLTVSRWLNEALPVHIGSQAAEWSADEVYLALPRPGGDGWVSIDRENGEVEAEFTDRGWLAYFNDLHKGRHTGAAWRWFIDLFAVACVVFTVSGLWLLQMHARQRRSTWPWVGLGLLLPLLIVLVFVH
ncbi:MAG: PepSY-associated TM helix domain-containing protein [Pseudomonadota bacterium]|nr:PepSY-associated TM helix domain-containing protein [Pseudomonadota bacterium]